MSRREWFSRVFELGMPVEAQPDLIERLRGTPARLEERVSGLAEAQWSQRPGTRWSIAEQAGHLGDLEGLWYGRIDDLLAGREVLREADLENQATWNAQHNDRPIAATCAAFRERRVRLIEKLEGLSGHDLQSTALHPRLRQPMTIVDLSFFVAEHDDHHLAAISALRVSGL